MPLGGIPSSASAKTIFEAARQLQLSFVPVTAIRFAPGYQAEIEAAAAQDGRGVLVRLRLEDFANPTLLAGYLNAIPQVLGITRDQIDILIDLAHRTERVVVAQLGGVNLGMLPNIND